MKTLVLLALVFTIQNLQRIMWFYFTFIAKP